MAFVYEYEHKFLAKQLQWSPPRTSSTAEFWPGLQYQARTLLWEAGLKSNPRVGGKPYSSFSTAAPLSNYNLHSRWIRPLMLFIPNSLHSSIFWYWKAASRSEALTQLPPDLYLTFKVCGVFGNRTLAASSSEQPGGMTGVWVVKAASGASLTNSWERDTQCLALELLFNNSWILETVLSSPVECFIPKVFFS